MRIRNTLPLAVIVGLVMGLIIFSMNPNKQTLKVSTPAQTERVEKNTKAFNDCLADRLHCEGGYVNMNGITRRISSCDFNCNVYEMSLKSIEIRMAMKNPWLPQDSEWVALPSDKIAWEKAAVKYARQFVIPQRLQ